MTDLTAAPTDRPLAGRHILITRPEHQAASLRDALTARGAVVTAVPLIRIARFGEPEGPDSTPVKRWVEALRRQAAAADPSHPRSWLVLTSANGVDAVTAAIRQWGGPTGLHLLAGHRLAAVGPATAAKLDALGLTIALVPAVHTGAALGEALAPLLAPGQRVTLPRGNLASPVLPEKLRATGADVVEMVVYNTVPDRSGYVAVASAIRSGAVDTVVFTSPSAVAACLEALGASDRALLQACTLAAIGPVTAAALERADLSPEVVPAAATVAGLAEALTAAARPK